MELGIGSETVLKNYMILDSELAGHFEKRETVGFTLVAEDFRVSSAKDDVKNGFIHLDYFGEGLEHYLDSLVAAEQTECEDDCPAGHAELGFIGGRFLERDLGNAVRYKVDLADIDIVDIAEHGNAAAVHNDHAVGDAAEVGERFEIGRRGLLEHGVKSCDDGNIDLLQEDVKVAAGGTAEKTKFVLDGKNVDAAEVNVIGGAEVVVFDISTDFEFYGLVITAFKIRLHGDDDGLEFEVGGELEAINKV